MHDKEKYLTERFDCLMNEFQKANASAMNLEEENNNSENFPDYYCGAHLNFNGSLDIFVNKKEETTKMLEFFDSEFVSVKIARFSMNQLIDTYLKISEFSELVNGSTVSINQEKNIVEITCESEEKLAKMKDLIKNHEMDFEMMSFNIKKISSKLCAAIAARSGNQVNTQSYKNPEGISVVSIATILCNIYNSSNGQYGIITCDHIFDDYGKRDYLYLTEKDTVIGGVNKYVRNSQVDCALLYFSSSMVWTPNDRLYNYLNKSIPGVITGVGAVVSALEGTSVRKYGITSGREDGVIVSSYYSIDGTVNQILCSNKCVGGDSGGPIGQWTDASPDTMLLYGMTRLRIISEGSTNGYTVASKASSTLSALGVSLYKK